MAHREARDGEEGILSVVRLEIESLAYGGDAVARDADGRAVFVHGACPGDVVEARVVQDKGRFARAQVDEVITPSADRVTAPCPYFGLCGGCSWQHVSYERQLDAKRQAVVDALTRIGTVAHADGLVAPCLPSDPYGYRNKVELLPTMTGRRLRLGFSLAHEERVVPIDECLLLPDRTRSAPRALSGALSFIAGRHDLAVERVGLRVAARTGDVEVALWTPPGPFPRKAVAETLATAVKATSVVRVLFKGPIRERRVTGVEVLGGRGFFRERLAGFTYGVSAPSFFQVNTRQAERLVSAALELLAPGDSDLAVDLFAGAGTFTLPLAELAGQTVSIESSSSAIRDLRRNLEHAGVFAEVIGGDAAREIAQLGTIDLALVDPPRAGLAPDTVRGLAAARPRAITYVSCDPATLARDVARFMDLGYTLQDARPVDLFPQSFHVETVALLTR